MKKRSHFRHLAKAALFYIVPVCLFGCSRLETPHTGEQVTVAFLVDGIGPETKSRDPQENLLTDINLFIFNEAGQMEESRYLKRTGLQSSDGGYRCEVSLLKNCRYSIYVCANTGNSLPIHNMQELMQYHYYLVYEDEYAIGIPMSGCRENVVITGQKQIDIPLKRTMARISVCIDRSRLYNDVTFLVKSIKVGGCPRRVQLFADSRITSKDEAFTVGFMKSGLDAEALNTNEWKKKSKELSLYMFENLQGDQLYGAASYKEKYFDKGDPRENICSYIEIKIDYISPTYYSKPGQYLIYRLYLGDDACNFDVRRNTHYHITLIPEGDGLQGDGWRVDKTAIVSS